MDVPPQEASSKGKEATKTKRKRKSPLVTWKKPKGMPKRPLSAYNLFFQHRRQSIMEEALFITRKQTKEGDDNSRRKASKKTTGDGFANLAKKIGSEWKGLDAERKVPYEKQAATEKQHYDREMKVWRAKEQAKNAAREQQGPIVVGDANIDFYIGRPPVPTYSYVARKEGRYVHVDNVFNRMGSRRPSDTKQQQCELKRWLDAPIHASSSNYADAMTTSPFQVQTRAMQQKVQDPNDCSLSALPAETGSQLSGLIDSILQNQSQLDVLLAQESQRMNSPGMGSGVQQSVHSYQYNQPHWFPRSNTHGGTHFTSSGAETMHKASAPPGFSNMDSSECFDLEPVPIADTLFFHPV